MLADPRSEEFVYLNAAGPYDLVIVRHNEINPEHYYTMSRSGVIQHFQARTRRCGGSGRSGALMCAWCVYERVCTCAVLAGEKLR